MIHNMSFIVGKVDAHSIVFFYGLSRCMILSLFYELVICWFFMFRPVFFEDELYPSFALFRAIRSVVLLHGKTLQSLKQK